MSNISKISGLKQPHLDYIILSFSKTSNLEKIKESFQKFFETGITGELLLEAAKAHKDEIQELRSKMPFEETISSIDIAHPATQLELLDELRQKCMEDKVFNVTREGTPLTKTEFSTALRCIEIAHKIRMDNLILELKKLEVGTGGGTGGSFTIEETTNKPQLPQINIVHKRDE